MFCVAKIQVNDTSRVSNEDDSLDGKPLQDAGDSSKDMITGLGAVVAGGVEDTQEQHKRASNTATEIIGDTIETVDVSKHPTPSIPESDLSLADIERSQSRTWMWVLYIGIVLVAVIAPYWVGRSLAVHHTQRVVESLSAYSTQGVALLTWSVTVVMFAGLAMALVESHNWLWRIVFVIGLAAEQFIAGLALLKLDFWYSTYVVYGKSSGLVNAADVGIIAAGIGVAVYAVVFVGLLVIISKDSPLNVLTKSWASFILFFGIETLVLIIVLFGGVLTTMA